MQLKKCKIWLKRGKKHVFLLKKAVFSDINLFHAANNVAKGVRVEELVAMSGHSASAVERAAKAATGRTLSAHILWTRLETAKKLLLFSNTPVSEVARLSGFSSPQYFCRFFKSRTGQTAERFRESAN